jgi:hypothetical protein
VQRARLIYRCFLLLDADTDMVGFGPGDLDLRLILRGLRLVVARINTDERLAGLHVLISAMSNSST